MIYRGHIRNGHITLDEPAELPEGARVHIDLIDERDDQRERLLRMSIEQRRAVLMRQAERLAEHYESDPGMSERA